MIIYVIVCDNYCHVLMNAEVNAIFCGGPQFIVRIISMN